MSVTDWPRSLTPKGHGVIRNHCSDFRVWEQAVCAPTRKGEHLWVYLSKEACTTVDVAKTLSKWADIPVRQIGYAGQKDRHAITQQWFSLHLPGQVDPDLNWCWPKGIKILKALRHERKLRRGALSGNRFQIIIRQFSASHEAIEEALAFIAKRGVPNYFGEQRFGRGGQNVERAKAYFSGRSRPDRSTQSILISAARSWLFNQVLASRVNADGWDIPQSGDLMMLSGSHSVFLLEDVTDETIQRTRDGDIHPTGPLPGERGNINVCDTPLEMETSVFKNESELMQGLIKQRIKSSRRPLRVIPQSMKAEWQDETTLSLDFELPAGSYATAVLRELCDYDDTQRRSNA
jgi:tRNA pseudouridine13 synthase